MSNDKDNVMDLLDSLDVKQSQKAKPKKSSSKKKENAARKATGDDILQFLDELDPQKEQPKQSSGQDSQTEANGSPKGSEGNSESKATQADDKQPESSDQDKTQNEIPSIVDPVATISSWWTRNKGGLWNKAQNTIQDAVSDAVKQARQAEAVMRDEQKHFSFDSIQSRLTSVLNTIVPPISRHEQLRIHIFHDMVGYPSVDKLLYEVFDYVMDQVEGGGDLNLVVQKGKERHRVGSDYDVHRALNYARCTLADGVKLAKANVEEIRKTMKTNDEESKKDKEERDVNNIRISEVFVSIQPVVTLKEGNAATDAAESLYFVTYLADVDHDIELSTASQALPFEWAQWLDSDGKGFQETAIDPREWVFGWVEDTLNLAFGVVAQKYVTTRMGLTHKETKDEDN